MSRHSSFVAVWLAALFASAASLPVAVPPRWATAQALALRGGSTPSLDELEIGAGGTTLGDLEPPSPAKRFAASMKQMVAMFRSQGMTGDAVDALEAAANDDSSSEALLIEKLFWARREQTLLLDNESGDHRSRGLAMLAAEARKAHDAAKLPDVPFGTFMDTLAADAALPLAEFEADVDKRLGAAVAEFYAVVGDAPSFVAKVRASFSKKLPIVLENIAKFEAAAIDPKNAENADQFQGQLETMKQAVAQMEEMTTDTGREQLEKMRSELVAQVDGAKGEPLVAAQLAMRLRPVVAQLLGEGADDGDEEPASSSAGAGGGATGDAAPAPAPAATEGKKKGGFGLPWGKKNN